ncbi:MAG: branched chain amino acid aminotransferase, partial [Acidobacteria bacterium]
MSFPKSDKIWMNGKLVPWDDAKIHVGSHVIHYGSAVFEGVRCYATPDGPAVFRLDAHTERLYDSAKIYRMDVPYSPAEMNQAILETISVNQLDACYIRPIIYRGYGQLGVNPFPCPVDVAVMVWDWGRYLGAEALENGVDVRVSSWARIAPNTLPAMAKSAANYMNSQLIKMEAIKEGYAEGIALDALGYVSEGSGENLFLVKNDTLITPPLVSSVLPGITRDTVIALARRQGIPVVEQTMPREMLYIADELFMTGTAAEITPVRSVDKIAIGRGARGPVTEALQRAFFD